MSVCLSHSFLKVLFLVSRNDADNMRAYDHNSIYILKSLMLIISYSLYEYVGKHINVNITIKMKTGISTFANPSI